MLNDRIFIRISPAEKKRYASFARRAYGLALSLWIKMLMRKDYARRQRDDEE